MIWFLFAALTLIAIAALVVPMARGSASQTAPADDQAVFRDQLAEVDRDLARGTLNATEADSARLEIQRRMLASAARPSSAGAEISPVARALGTAGIAVIVPFVALGVYMGLGSPTLKNAPASGQAAAEHGDQQFNQMIDQLSARLAETPEDIKGWALLGRSYRQVEKFDLAREAFRRVLSLGPEGGEAFTDFGEMATAAAGGEVTSEALEAFLAALSRDREDPRARFYVGMSYAQRGDSRSAIAIWRDLTAAAPPDAPWSETVRQQMFQVAQASAIMPMNVEPRHPLDLDASPVAPVAPPLTAVAEAPPSDPDDVTSPDVTAIKDRFSSENLQGIQAMVGSLAGRLENNPDDYNGWMMLGRSYMVLKNTDGAKRAFQKAIALKPAELAPKTQFIALLWGETNVDGPGPLPASLTEAARDVLTVDPNNPEGLLVEGLAALKSGDAAGARERWTKAEASAPKGGALAAEIGRRLAGLKS